MASGSSSGRNFVTDDILCSYEDYNQDNSNGIHSDSVSGKEFHKSRMAKSSVFPASSYSPPEESINQDVLITTVERTMKKYADNLMRFLEGISSRLSQLELYCYNLDKSIGEMRSELARDNGEADSKLKFLEKHLQEVHRSVQILRDKQELAKTQKELAKIQLAQKESNSATHSQQGEERDSPLPSDPKISDVHSQLALALPSQVAPQPQAPSRPVEHPQHPVPHQQPMPPQNLTSSQGYYLPAVQLSNLPPSMQAVQYQPSDSQYRAQPQPTQQSQVNQAPAQNFSLPQYQQQQQQQQWAQQGQPPQQTSLQPQIRPTSPAPYPPYMPSQSANANPSPQEILPNSMPMQMPYSGISQPVSSRAEAMSYGYGGVSRPIQPQTEPPSQHLKAAFGAQPGDGYAAASGPHPTLSPGNTYMMYDSEGGGRPQHLTQPPHFQQSGYSQNRPPQIVRNHPYNELVEKLVSMGYRGDHAVGVIQRLEESGQPVDFNAVLDRLNVHPSGGGPQRGGWSG